MKGNGVIQVYPVGCGLAVAQHRGAPLHTHTFIGIKEHPSPPSLPPSLPPRQRRKPLRPRHTAPRQRLVPLRSSGVQAVVKRRRGLGDQEGRDQEERWKRKSCGQEVNIEMERATVQSSFEQGDTKINKCHIHTKFVRSNQPTLLLHSSPSSPSLAPLL